MPVPVKPSKVAAVPLTEAVTTPLVLVSIIFRFTTVAAPVTVTATVAEVSIVVALIAVATALSVPVSLVAAVAIILTVVLPSSVFKSEAATVPVSVTVIV